MQSKVIALCLRVQFFLANSVQYNVENKHYQLTEWVNAIGFNGASLQLKTLAYKSNRALINLWRS